MKRHEPHSIRDILETYLRENEVKDSVDAHRALYAWPEIVGPQINRYTTRRYVSPSGEMHVYIASGVLKQELSFRTDSLVRALNRAVGCDVITKVVIH